MRGAEDTAHVIVIFRMLIGIANNKSDRCTGRFSFENATQQFHSVCFFPAGSNLALPGATSIQFVLYELQVDTDARRHTVYHPSDALSVAFAEGCKRKKITERVSHALCFYDL